jgi:hypothetical protein
MVVYTGTGLFHSKILVADALIPKSDPQVATGSFNWSTVAETKNDENLIIIHDATVANEYYQSLCKNITDNGGAACITPVPVKWVTINAFLINNSAKIKWETTDEVNNNHFEIEHSINGWTYQKIGVVDAKQNTNNNYYQFTDTSINEGINYYRIKQVDNNGSYAFSKVISLITPVDESLIYTTVVNKVVKVKIQANLNKLNICLIDVSGKKLFAQNVSNAIAGQQIDIPASNYATGVYFININTDKGTKTDKIVIQ